VREEMSQGVVGDSRWSSRMKVRRVLAKWVVVRRKEEERGEEGMGEWVEG
jgi:hypothetical protein